MKRVDDDSQQSVPLIKSPSHEEMSIISKDCSRCGKKVQHVNGNPQKHECIK